MILQMQNNKNHNKRWPYVPDHPYRMSISGVSGSGKTNALPFFVCKRLSEPKYQFCIKNMKMSE